MDGLVKRLDVLFRDTVVGYIAATNGHTRRFSAVPGSFTRYCSVFRGECRYAVRPTHTWPLGRICAVDEIRVTRGDVLLGVPLSPPVKQKKKQKKNEFLKYARVFRV